MKLYSVLKECKPFLNAGTVDDGRLKELFREEGIAYLVEGGYIKLVAPEYNEMDVKEFASDYHTTLCDQGSIHDMFNEWKSKRS